jgi:hypothetical protein
MKARAPILVTGAPRTGTTLLGAMLGLASRTGILFEPFHPDAGVEGIRAEYERETHGTGPLRLEFPFVSEDHPAAACFRSLFDAVLTGRVKYQRPRYRGRFGWVTVWARRVLTSRLALHNRWAAAWPFHERFVIKDPHLCLASEFAHRSIGADCVVTVRHPAATVESWTRLGWNPDLRQFWRQPLLWDRYLSGLPRPDVERSSPLEKAAYAWLYIHTVLWKFQERNPDMRFLHLEDIAERPVEELQALYARLGLPFDPSVQRAIARHTMAASDAVGTGARPHRLKRNSRSVVAGWKRRLSVADQETVRRIVGDTGAMHYPSRTW